VKSEIIRHSVPLVLILLLAYPLWFFRHLPYYQFIFLPLGLALGAFVLDTDHLIYWFYTQSNLPESQQARSLYQQKKYRQMLHLLTLTHKNHVSLIFHHYIFQAVLLLVSIFVFTSTNDVFGKSFLLAINIHLLVDEFEDLKQAPMHLQNWLFARSPKQLPVAYLGYYFAAYTISTSLFTLLLILFA
jgi:hypothetical protein